MGLYNEIFMLLKERKYFTYPNKDLIIQQKWVMLGMLFQMEYNNIIDVETVQLEKEKLFQLCDQLIKELPY